MIRTERSGNVATYIPQVRPVFAFGELYILTCHCRAKLAKVNPDLFGIAVCNSRGGIYEVGDSDVDFSIQSCSKPISYCIAHQSRGRDLVHSHVGYEPSGQSFNAFALNKSGLPHNPCINSGAMMVASLLFPNEEPSERFSAIKEVYSRAGGNVSKVGFDNSTFLSERQCADRNISLMYFMVSPLPPAPPSYQCPSPLYHHKRPCDERT